MQLLGMIVYLFSIMAGKLTIHFKFNSRLSRIILEEGTVYDLEDIGSTSVCVGQPSINTWSVMRE